MIRIALLALMTAASCGKQSETMTTPLHDYITQRLAESPEADRIELLQPLADAIAKSKAFEVIFICTHNSRRSHLSQIWAQVGARHFGLDGVVTFSGGTEATAFNPRAVAALQRAGLEITSDGAAENPIYTVKGDGDLTMECFSKCFHEQPNPMRDFAAVMTCSEADESCPLVPGAALRFAIPYIDPKVSDGTPEESATYDERCRQIATEMLWVMRTAAAARG